MRAELRDDLCAHPAFHAAVERLWPELTPERVLAALFASAPGAPWTVADAPLPAEVHTPVSAKRLEFDVVVVVDPERIVALTRATRRLGLVHVARRG